MSEQSTTSTEKKVVDEVDEDLFSSEQKAELKQMKDLESKVEEKIDNLQTPKEGKIDVPKFDQKMLDGILKQIQKMPKNERNKLLSNMRNNMSVNQEKQKFSTVTDYNKKDTLNRLKQLRENMRSGRRSKHAQMYQEKKQEAKQQKTIDSEQTKETPENKEEQSKETQEKKEEQTTETQDKKEQ